MKRCSLCHGRMWFSRRDYHEGCKVGSMIGGTLSSMLDTYKEIEERIAKAKENKKGHEYYK